MFKNSVGILLKFKNLQFVLKIFILFPHPKTSRHIEKRNKLMAPKYKIFGELLLSLRERHSNGEERWRMTFFEC